MPEVRIRSAIQAYLDDKSDSRLPAHLAAQSKLPHACTSKLQICNEAPAPGNGTSMLLSGNDSLAALSTISSATTLASISTAIGEQDCENSRILIEGDDGALLLPAPRSEVVLECPFYFLSCRQTFSATDDWFKHSMSHFSDVGPPTNNSCCFCNAEFEAENGLRSWAERMQHVAFHHQLGCRLAHARPDFALKTYLWIHRLISDATYKDIMGHNSNHSLPEDDYRYHSTSFAKPQIYTNSISSINSRQERLRRRRTTRGHAMT